MSALAGTRIAVVSVAHRGDDARIFFRQIRSLREAGATICYLAPPPHGAYGLKPPGTLERVIINRTSGWKRLGPWYQAFREIRSRKGQFNAIIVHDLEAVFPVLYAKPGCPIIWDVHENNPAVVFDRSWVPNATKPALHSLITLLERVIAKRCHIFLAEESYRERFGDQIVIPNTTYVPEIQPAFIPQNPPVVIYIGRISRSRGLYQMIALGKSLRHRIKVVLIGPVDAPDRLSLESAINDGSVDWLGPLPNAEALTHLQKASVGLSLLEETANFKNSMPTKIHEYLAHGVPVITTPLPMAVTAVRQSEGGTIVAPYDEDALEDAVLKYTEDHAFRIAVGLRGHRWATENSNWLLDQNRFINKVRSISSLTAN